MATKAPIPVHRLDDRFAGLYLAPLSAAKTTSPPYEASEPHRHDFYYCVLLDQGTLQLEVDFEPVQLTGHSLFLSYPGQIHRVTAAHPERGWFVAFTPAMLDEPLRDVLDQCLAEVVLLPLTAGQASDFTGAVEQLQAVYDNQEQLFRQPILQALLRALVYRLAASYLPLEKLTLRRYSARSLAITKAFKQLLRQQGKALRKPADFAARLHLSASYLNDTVRSVTGFSLTYYLQQEVMREARRLLSHSGLSVQEVAYQLGFDDAHYFNRLFRKVTGVAPGAFRKRGEAATPV